MSRLRHALTRTVQAWSQAFPHYFHSLLFALINRGVEINAKDQDFYACAGHRLVSASWLKVTGERDSASPVARVQRSAGPCLLVRDTCERTENFLATLNPGDYVSLMTWRGDKVAPD